MDIKITKVETGLEESRNQVRYIESLFQDAGVKISELSFLYKLLQDIKENYSESNTLRQMHNAIHVDVIASTLECIKNNENKVKYLKDMLNGSLDFLERKPSHAKAILWELDVFSYIKPVYDKVYLDEPDIVVPFEDGDIGIACKKIFSEKRVQSVLSEAVKQVRSNSFDFGIVAINIDDLFPAGKIASTQTFADVKNFLRKTNMDFLIKHEHHFRRYLNDSRIIAVFVSSSIIADMKEESSRHAYLSYRTTWTVDELKESHKERIEHFNKLFESSNY